MTFPPPIPSDLNNLLPYPTRPWMPSVDLANRLGQISLQVGERYKKCKILPTDPEYRFVERYILDQPLERYCIGSIYYIENANLLQAFEAELINMEEEVKTFLPRWKEEDLKEERANTLKRWEKAVSVFPNTEISAQNNETIEKIISAKVMPLFHGSNPEKCHLICRSGFTYFGKHQFFGHGDNTQESTDIGFFGSGIYGTNSARYAALYGLLGGQKIINLLLSWFSMRQPFPVVSDAPKQKCSDMIKLQGKGGYQNYNAHYIPVVSNRPHDPLNLFYVPCHQNEPTTIDEVVVFSKAQTLPRFWIELVEKSEAVPPPMSAYSFAQCFLACQSGDINQVYSWIKEDRKRLQEANSQGENLLYGAVFGGQLELLKWLHEQNTKLIYHVRDDGFTLMHVATEKGLTEIVKWLHAQDSSFIIQATSSKQLTPLHLAAFNEHISILNLFLKEIADLNIALVIAEKSCPQTLAFLLQKGTSPNLSNRFKQTLLHLAAQAGQEDNIRHLLKYQSNSLTTASVTSATTNTIPKDININALDLSHRTPLFLAVLQGHRAIVNLLIQFQADVTIQSNAQETILHAAAFHGHTAILSDLLSYPVCKSLIAVQDMDGKMAIHKAVWSSPKPDIVQLLLDHGADPNAKTKDWGYTPLHWAAKHGHLASLKILLQRNATLEFNKNQESPLDLAIKCGQDAIVYELLNINQNTMFPFPSSQTDLLQYLQQFQQKNAIEEQVFCLEKISDLYIDKQDFVQGAKTLNQALALLKNNALYQNHLLRKLERIEGLFLNSHQIKTSANKRNYLETHRESLKNMRFICKESLKKNLSPQQILVDCATESKKILASLVKQAYQSLPPATTPWACVMMNPLSTKELFPYQSLGIAFVIKEKTPATLSYFQVFFQLLELQIINLGETPFSILNDQRPVMKGFSMETYQTALPQLIGTPKELACFQQKASITNNLALANAMSGISFIDGEKDLALDYYKQMKVIFSSYEKGQQANLQNGQFLAMQLFNKHASTFNSLSLIKDQPFDLQQEVSSLFLGVLQSLALWHHVQGTDSLKLVDQFIANKVFSFQGGANIKKALCSLFCLQLEAQLFYHKEQSFLYYAKQGEALLPHQFYLNPAQLAALQEIYYVLIPFYEKTKQFFKTINKKVLQDAFYEIIPEDKLEILKRLQLPKKN